MILFMSSRPYFPFYSFVLIFLLHRFKLRDLEERIAFCRKESGPMSNGISLNCAKWNSSSWSFACHGFLSVTYTEKKVSNLSLALSDNLFLNDEKESDLWRPRDRHVLRECFVETLGKITLLFIRQGILTLHAVQFLRIRNEGRNSSLRLQFEKKTSERKEVTEKVHDWSEESWEWQEYWRFFLLLNVTCFVIFVSLLFLSLSTHVLMKKDIVCNIYWVIDFLDFRDEKNRFTVDEKANDMSKNVWKKLTIERFPEFSSTLLPNLSFDSGFQKNSELWFTSVSFIQKERQGNPSKKFCGSSSTCFLCLFLSCHLRRALCLVFVG